MSAAAPSIVSGIVLLLVGGFFGACGRVVVGAIKRWRGVAKEHTDLVCHLEESDNLKADIKELKELQEIQNEVLRELIGRELDREHERLVKQGFASTTEKDTFERMYKPYHSINGNGTRTASYEDVMCMAVYPQKSGHSA